MKRWSDLIPRGGRVLDVASGGGRHTRWFAAAGYTVEAVDRDIGQLAGLADIEAITVCRLDLEAEVWPYSPASFAGIVVTNYLHRPLFPSLLEALAAGGVLIYETFAVGNARYGKPRNPDYLLRPGELREVVAGRLEILGFEEG
ncbi:MAG TPA: SAM-dependent methyltransferase, partial [Betaproteobacteria bacterium]|nr:SAM-dependent methyltransferase [Betaproteobacteria bacterium]